MNEFSPPLSRNEAILQNILGADNDLGPARSRVEAILLSILNDTPYTDEPISRIEKILLAIKNKTEYNDPPRSRNEAILLCKLHGEEYTEPPRSRIEELLIAWASAAQPEKSTVTGTAPVTLEKAVVAELLSLIQYGKVTQATTPTPPAPVDIVCNNGTLKYGVLGKNWFDFATVGIEQGAISSSDGGNSNSTYRVRTAGYVPVKPSTQYTLSAVIDGYTSGASRGVFILEYATNAVAGYTGDSSGWKSPNGYTFTTGATTHFIRIVFAKGSSSSSSTVPADVSNVQLELGDTATPYEPYKGVGLYVDGTPEVLTVGGKNITSYVLDLTVEGDETGGVVINDLLTGGVPKENTRYTISVDIASNNVTYSENGNLVYFRVFYSDGTSAYAGVTNQNYTQSKISVTTTAGKTFDRLSLYKHARFTGGTIRLTNLQVEEGTTATDYEPYKGAPQTASAENLYQVGDYADEQEIISGAVTRRIGVYVFDGTETWIDGNYGYITEDVQDQSGDTYSPLCTHYKGTTGTPQSNTNSMRCYRTSGGVGRIYIAPNRTTYPTKEDFAAFVKAQYEAGTPIIVMYPLATATTESVTPQSLSTVAGTNVISITAEVSPIELEVEYYKEAEA